ncbi:small acid-soluble spore protein SspI [Paenibacillus senegalensis]|uniref:small acid-soluble spore protein SspI n=1 Tax=Paenibacillus senegalensis TaxID=1465766 RepID=UPI0002888CBC|nr:small acid-soluble spore protein SspI [Paenibacillus senegalensis]
MNIDLRQAIVQRVQGKSLDELKEIIEDSVGGADQTLPGLGVLFEIIWEHTEQADHDTMLNALKNNLPQ